MRLYLISDQQLDALLHGSVHEKEGATETIVDQQEVTVNQAVRAIARIEADRNKGGSE